MKKFYIKTAKPLVGMKIIMKVLKLILVSALWWGLPAVFSKWLGINISVDKLFITYSFLIFILLIIEFTSVKIQIPGINFNSDKLGQLFKASYGKDGFKDSYEFFYDSDDDFKRKLKIFKSIIDKK